MTPRKVTIEPRPKTKPTRWRLKWAFDGVPQSTTVYSKAEALLAAGAISGPAIGCDVEGKDPRVKSGSLWGMANTPAALHPFETVAEAAIAERVASSNDKTRAGEWADVQRHMAGFAGRDVGAITGAECQDLINEWAKTYAKTTVVVRAKLLSKIFRFAQKRGYRADNPTLGLIRPTPQRRAAVHRIRAEHVAPLLAGCTREIYADCLRVLLATGLRVSELTALNVGDVEGNVVHVRKGKTEEAKRSIVVDDETARVLARHVGTRTGYEDPLWIPRRGGRLTVGSLDTAWRAARTKAGLLDRGYRLHDFRHTHAHWLLDAGHELHTVKERLGHATIAITSDYYGGSVAGQDARAAKSVGALIAAAMAPQTDGLRLVS